jgi:hypothetical protein
LQKQSTVALSSTEVEYIALLEVVWEVEWVQSFLEELGIRNNLPTTIYKDNQAALCMPSLRGLLGVWSTLMLNTILHST